MQKRPFSQSKELDFESGYIGFLSGTRTIRVVYSGAFRVYFLIGAYDFRVPFSFAGSLQDVSIVTLAAGSGNAWREGRSALLAVENGEQCRARL